MKPSRKPAILAILLTTALCGLTLTACDKSAVNGQAPAPSNAPPPGAMPLDPNATGVAYSPAPSAGALPAAPPARLIAPRPGAARYDYVNRAAELNSAFADSPPDYAVNYQGARPWYWRARDGAYRVVENTPDGARYYYYNAGEDQPYLVRDSRYAYGFDQGGLAVIYDADGRPLPDYEAQQRSNLAGQYLARARALYLAAERDRHEAAYANSWAAVSVGLAAQRQSWDRQRQRDPDWRAWRDQQGPASPDWHAEAATRQAYTATYGRAAQSADLPGSSPPSAQLPRPSPPQFAPQQSANRSGDAQANVRAQQARAEVARQAQLAAQASQQQSQAQARAAAEAARRQQAKVDEAQRIQAQAKVQAGAQAEATHRAQLADQAQRQQAQAQALAQAQAARRADAQVRAAADTTHRQQLQADAALARQAEQARLELARQKKAGLDAQAAAGQRAEAQAARRKAAAEATKPKDTTKEATRPTQPPKSDAHPQP